MGEALNSKRPRCQIVQLNVSGRHVDVAHSTLVQAPYFAERLGGDDAADGLRMFVDRDPDTFALILKYLRGGRTSSALALDVLSEQQRVDLLCDAQHYGLAALADELRALRLRGAPAVAPAAARGSSVTPGDIVRLNVGGRHFDTTRATLLGPLTSGASVFRRLLDGLHHSAGARRDESGRIFIDRDGESFALVLKHLRSMLELETLSTQQRAELLSDADFYGLTELAIRLHALAEPESAERAMLAALSDSDRAIRAQGSALYAALKAGPVVAPSAPEEADAALIDVLAQPDAFAYDGTPTSPAAPLLLPSASAAQRCIERAPGDGLRCEDAASFLARLRAFAGFALLDGLDMTDLVVAGGSVLLALCAHARTHSDWLGVDPSADIDLFVVTDDEERARAAYRRVRAHLVRALSGAERDRAAAKLEAATAQLAHADHVLGAVMAAEDAFAADDAEEAFLDARAAVFRAQRELDAATEGAEREILVVRSRLALTFYAGYPRRTVQLVLRRHRSVGDLLFRFDVDACQLAYDGARVLATPAARRALTSGVLFADPERTSSAYEARMIKYAKRGFAIALPGVDLSRIDPRWLSGCFVRTHGRQLRRAELAFAPSGRVPSVRLAPGEIRRLPKLLVLGSLRDPPPHERTVSSTASSTAAPSGFDAWRAWAERLPLLASERDEEEPKGGGPALVQGRTYLINLPRLEKALDPECRAEPGRQLETDRLWNQPTPPHPPPPWAHVSSCFPGHAGDDAAMTGDAEYSTVLLPFHEGLDARGARSRLDKLEKARIVMRTPKLFCYDLARARAGAAELLLPHVDDSFLLHSSHAPGVDDVSPSELTRHVELASATCDGPWFRRQSAQGWFDGVHSR